MVRIRIKMRLGGCVDGICEECGRIDFKNIFQCEGDQPLTKENDEPYYPIKDNSRSILGRVSLKNIDTCPLCAFFDDCYPDRTPNQKLGVYSGSLSDICGYDDIPRNLDSIAMYLVESGRANTFFRSPLIVAPKCINQPKLAVTSEDEDEDGGGDDDEHCKHLGGRQIRPDVIDYDVIRQWLHMCSSTHSGCVDGHFSLNFKDLPEFRLIDCSTGTMVPAFQAREREYVTLSYVWGPAPVISSLTKPFALPDELPLVVADAIKVTMNLGYRYLWVDRYCIPQDNAKAKQRQIQNMGKIYSRSALTIIAAAGEDSEYGLPGVSCRERITHHLALDNGRLRLSTIHLAKFDITPSKWNSRGWTYQEGILSRRRLVFTDHNVYFQCERAYTSDDIRLPPTGRFHTSNAPDPNHEIMPFLFSKDQETSSHAWYTIGKFAERNLTYDSDALDAVAGVLHRFPPSTVRFLCGLPVTVHPECPSPPPDTGGVQVPVECSALSNLLLCRRTSTEKTSNITSNHNSLYSRSDISRAVLVDALLWQCKWSATATSYWPQPHTSTSNSPRRSGFPSWTWAGWKSTNERMIKFSGSNSGLRCPRSWERPGRDSTKKDIEFLPCTISVSFSRVSGDNIKGGIRSANKKPKPSKRLLKWPEASKQILSLSDQGKLTNSRLIIKGSVFDVKVAVNKKNNGVDLPPTGKWSDDGWEITWPPALAGSPVEVPPGLLDEHETHDLLALLFRRGIADLAPEGFLDTLPARNRAKVAALLKKASEASSLPRGRIEVGCFFLILRPVEEEGVVGGTVVYERVSSCDAVMLLDHKEAVGEHQMEEADRLLGVRTMEVMIR
ncbi:heterokaryon incompatibility protein domain-containing protein [Neurospora intermedia]|uniref:Heterokaryon incompatibility protein domain-containing protein n=1 Tax=Neurospora intermedia TaxID=5142 RepID=A0ABR3DMD3_NEUIN